MKKSTSNKTSSKTKVSPLKIIFLLIIIAAVCYLALQFGDLKKVSTILFNASWGWVVLAIALTGVANFLTAVIQYVAGNNEGSLKSITLIEFAGSFLNHFLPYSVGGIGLISSYYRKIGYNRPKSIIVATIPMVISIVTTFIIILIVSPVTVINIANNIKLNIPLSILIPAICAVVAIIALIIFIFRNKIKKFINETVDELKYLKDIRQLFKLSGWSALQTLSLAVTLFVSILAIGCHLNFLVVVGIFLSSQLVAETTPLPGGVGATEVVLALGLTSAGLSAAEAFSATLLFRFISYILPLIPGAYSLFKLNHDRSLKDLSEDQ